MKIQNIYNEIELKQGENKEIKVYILMSGFYKYVIFKTNEYLQELNKSRLIFQTLKIDQINKGRGINDDKGLILARLSLRKHMEIEFINKTCCKMFQYT